MSLKSYIPINETKNKTKSQKPVQYYTKNTHIQINKHTSSNLNQRNGIQEKNNVITPQANTIDIRKVNNLNNNDMNQSFTKNYGNNEEFNNHVVKNVEIEKNSNNKRYLNPKDNQVKKSNTFNINNKNKIYNHTINRGISKERENPKEIRDTKRKDVDITKLGNIKSILIMKKIFAFLNEKGKLYIIKYNKYYQKFLSVDIKYYKEISGKYIIYGKNRN